MVLIDNEYFIVVQYGLSAFHYAYSRDYKKTWRLLEKKADVYNVKNGVSFNAYSFYAVCEFFISCFNRRITGQLWI